MGIFDLIKNIFGSSSEAAPASSRSEHQACCGSSTTSASSASACATEDEEETAFENTFDFENEPEAWWIASRRIEKDWDDEAAREKLLAEYGIEGEDHFMFLRQEWDTFCGRLASLHGEAGYREMLQHCINAESVAFTQQAKATVMAASPEILEPIEGVSIQDYGRIVARVAAGEDLDAILTSFSMDRPKYERVGEGWNQRMAQDLTFTISQEYSKAFIPATNAARGTTDVPALTWEQCIEITEAQSAGTAAGMDPQAVFQKLGTTLSDYVSASQYWGQWFNERAIADPSLVAKHNELSDKYRAKYAVAKGDQDIEF